MRSFKLFRNYYSIRKKKDKKFIRNYWGKNITGNSILEYEGVRGKRLADYFAFNLRISTC